jgi:hypothetical protein
MTASVTGWLRARRPLRRWESAPLGYIIEALADAFHCVGTGGNIEQVLMPRKTHNPA